MDMICPTCRNPTTHHHEGKPSPCDGCQESAKQLNANLQADRKARFAAPTKKRDLSTALLNHGILKRRERYRNPSDIDRKPEP